MATEQQVIGHLQTILSKADLETVTEDALKGQLTSHFCEDMTQHEVAIMVQIPRSGLTENIILGRPGGLFNVSVER